MVKCPICSEKISLSTINEHLDVCELKNRNKNKSNSATPERASPNQDSTPHIETIESEHTKKEPITQPSKSLSSLLSGKKRKEKTRTYQYQPSQHILHSESSPEAASSSQNLSPNNLTSSNKRVREDESLKETTLVTKKPKNPIIEQLKLTHNLPLSERLRPTEISKYIGQSHLIGPNGILRGYLKHGKIPSLILWGKPGTGKTTLARILAKTTTMRFIEMSGVINGVSDCKKVFEEAVNEMKLTKKPTIIFVDEIHRFSKSQQDIFLNYVERGIIVLIGATTENPSFTINKAILSRCRVFTLEKLTTDEMKEMVGRGIVEVNKVRKLIYDTSVLKLSKDAIDWIVTVADGDARQALGFIEMVDSNFNEEGISKSTLPSEVNVEDVKKLLKKSPMLYDRQGDAHYDTISAFHKSIRGSNPDAALFYLARMISAGEDPLYIARRMIVIASEDIGVRDETCLPFAAATYQAVQFVGLPEAEINMAHCAVKLARAPKSIEVYRAWKQMKELLSQPEIEGAEIPMHLRNAPTKLMSDLGYSKGYKYNPNFKDGKVKQTYFPEQIGELNLLQHEHLGTLVDDDLQDNFTPEH